MANNDFELPHDSPPAPSYLLRLKQDKRGLVFSYVLTAVAAASFVGIGFWESSYLLFGKTAIATVTRKAGEYRSSKSGGRAVVVVEYTFALPGGESRSGHDELSSDWTSRLEQSVDIEYVPFLAAASRVKGAHYPFQWSIVLGIATLFLSAISWAVAKSIAKAANPDPLEPLSSSGAPHFSQGSLVCRGPGVFKKRPVSVIVDQAAGLIHFQDCHWPLGFWVIRSTPWFSCPLSKVRSAKIEECKGVVLLKLVTESGSARIADSVSNFQLLCDLFGQVPGS